MYKQSIWWMALLMLCVCLPAGAAADSFQQQMQALEKASGGRLGVAVVTDKGELLLGYRETQRFALCSTFKLPLAALVLHQVDQGKASLDRRLAFSAADLEDYAPVARRYLASGYMTVAEANQASLQFSDNTTANLLLQMVGGPAVVTRYFRQLGDKVSRLDRNEPSLNTNLPDDPRDASEPQAIAQTLAKLVLGDALQPASRERLQRLLIGNTTGDAAIRAGLPDDWTVGDKTGSCDNAGRNDVAFVVAPGLSPFILAVYSSNLKVAAEQQNAVIAKVATLVATSLRQRQ